MQMVAASRMKKAQDAALFGKPYRQKINETVVRLSQGVDKSLHPLLRDDDKLEGKTLNILISTNKGLCGGLNTNLFRAVQRLFLEKENIDYLTMGKKGESFIVRTKKNLVADFSSDNFLTDVPAVIAFCADGFLREEYKTVNLIFNEFINSLKQLPAVRRLLPIGVLAATQKEEIVESRENRREFLIEPSAPELLNSLLPHYLEIQLRNAILESLASEFSARMIAMKNATDNASSLISDLTLVYNQLRQQRITYEIADIVTASIGIN